MPRRPAALLLTLATVVTSFAAAQESPTRLVARAVTAMGGAEALRGLGVTVLEFNGATFALGQEETPLSPPRAAITSGRFITDWRESRRVTEQEVRLVSGAVTRARQVIANRIGMNDVNGNVGPTPPGAVATVLRGLDLQPNRLLLAALDHPAALSALPPGSFRGETLDGVRYARGPDTVNLWFDRLSGLLTVSEQVIDDAILGDRRTLMWYTRWRAADGSGGVKFPWQVDTEVNGRLLAHNVVTSVRVLDAPDAAVFAIPDSIARRATPAPSAPPPPAPLAVTLVELAPGVWRAEGGSHHSLVVDQGQRLLVVEAPQSTARSNAVLDTLRRRFPDKPVGVVVNTHHHHDHAGGLRGYLARGVPVATHARNVDFVRAIAAARKTVAPDALSRGAPVPDITGVADSLTLGTGSHQVHLVTIASSHAEGILAAYLPGQRLLFISDVLSPSANLPSLGSAEVVALGRSRGLAIDRVVGAHGGVATWAEVERAAAP